MMTGWSGLTMPSTGYGRPGRWCLILTAIGDKRVALDSTLVGKFGKEAIFTASGTLIVGYITKLVTGGLRVEEDSEVTGLDNTVHGERAFEIQLS